MGAEKRSELARFGGHVVPFAKWACALEAHLLKNVRWFVQCRPHRNDQILHRSCRNDPAALEETEESHNSGLWERTHVGLDLERQWAVADEDQFGVALFVDEPADGPDQQQLTPLFAELADGHRARRVGDGYHIAAERAVDESTPDDVDLGPVLMWRPPVELVAKRVADRCNVLCL